MPTPSDIIATRADLLAVRDEGHYYVSEDEYVSEADDPQEVRRRGLALLSIAVKMADIEAEKAEREAKVWEREYAVPLARMMYNTFHKSSDNYRDDASEELWLQRYAEDDHLVTKWVRVATATLKAQESGA